MSAFKKVLFEDITPERYRLLRGRFDKFLFNLDKDEPVIRVYDQLKQTQLDQLVVIREVSKLLQKKKEEDILKAKQAAEEASKANTEEEKEEGSEEKVEDTEGEENITETEKKDVN